MEEEAAGAEIPEASGEQFVPCQDQTGEIPAPQEQAETEELSVMTQAELAEAQLCLIRMLKVARRQQPLRPETRRWSRSLYIRTSQ